MNTKLAQFTTMGETQYVKVDSG